jgi:hypothetical protein
MNNEVVAYLQAFLELSFNGAILELFVKCHPIATPANVCFLWASAIWLRNIRILNNEVVSCLQ